MQLESARSKFGAKGKQREEGCGAEMCAGSLYAKLDGTTMRVYIAPDPFGRSASELCGETAGDDEVRVSCDYCRQSKQ